LAENEQASNGTAMDAPSHDYGQGVDTGSGGGEPVGWVTKFLGGSDTSMKFGIAAAFTVVGYHLLHATIEFVIPALATTGAGAFLGAGLVLVAVGLMVAGGVLGFIAARDAWRERRPRRRKHKLRKRRRSVRNGRNNSHDELAAWCIA
jgi:hypothetical protein